MSTAAETPTLSDSIFPAMGTPTRSSHSLRTLSPRPIPSEPTTSKQRCGYSCFRYEPPPDSAPYLQKPYSLASIKKSERLRVTATGVFSVAPADALTTAGVIAADRCLGITTAAPAALAVLITAPRL